jgi:peptide methionine sulfoxide reductase MsrA
LKLLEVFWSAHDPYGRQGSTQYKAVLWTHSEEQARIAKAFVAEKTKDRNREPTTEVKKATRFWIAEDYHQKYTLRSRKTLVRALLGDDWTDEALRDSLVAARVN